jgi:hypothetical protein
LAWVDRFGRINSYIAYPLAGAVDLDFNRVPVNDSGYVGRRDSGRKRRFRWYGGCCNSRGRGRSRGPRRR